MTGPDVVGPSAPEPEEPSREPIADAWESVSLDAWADYKAARVRSRLDPEDRRELCRILENLEDVGEDLSDFALAVTVEKVAAIVRGTLPRWLRWIPLPVGRIQDALDPHLPDLVTGPLRQLVGCPDPDTQSEEEQ